MFHHGVCDSVPVLVHISWLVAQYDIVLTHFCTLWFPLSELEVKCHSHSRVAVTSAYRHMKFPKVHSVKPASKIVCVSQQLLDGLP